MAISRIVLGWMILGSIILSLYSIHLIWVTNERVKALERELEEERARYSSLQSSYNELAANYQSLLLNNYNLTKSLENITLTYLSYTSLTHSFPRVLNSEEVYSVRDAVEKALVYPGDPWLSYAHIYAWVSANIRYTNDITLPVPRCELVSGNCALNYTFVNNYVQSPSLTLKLRAGDCEDMAILLYAMIKYYQLHVHGAEYVVWIAYIEFRDGSSHAAVFIPAKGGMLTILDPAGRYMTVDVNGLITARPAREELELYSNKWDYLGGIKLIELYRVDVGNGSYSVDAEGGIEEVSAYISALA